MSMFVAPEVTESGEFQLAEGCWPAVVVGLRGFMGTKFQSEEQEPKMQFVFQVKDDEGTIHYVATKPLANKINDKSNLFKVLNGITGYGVEKFPKGFQYTQLVCNEKPVKCQIVVKTVPSKKDPNKQYTEIDSILKAKKGQNNTFTPDDKAPAWLNQNCIETFWLNGLSFQAPKEEAPAKAAMPEVPSAVQLGNSSAFFGQTQNPTNPQFAAPGQYVPPAAPAPQPVFGQAPAAPTAPVVDDGDDLPFNGGRA